jgi:hypothetical protein
MGVFGHDTPML